MLMATPDEGWKITSALAAITDEAALNHLKQYFGLGEWAGRENTGAHFDSFEGHGPGRLTAEDIIAVACLSVHVPARAALEILGTESGEISRLLGLIPNSALEDVPFEAHDKWFGEGSAALLLWRLLRTHQDVDATTASKIMARKRLGLIPIYDSVVGRLTGFPTAKGTWRAWHQAFSTDAEFTDRLRSLREAAGLEHVTLLRILDVVLWMHGAQGVEGPERVDDSESA
jgi:hypothetical protein